MGASDRHYLRRVLEEANPFGRRKLVCWHREPGLFWVRVLGKGFYVRDIGVHPPMFSERNGYGRGYLVKRLR